MGWELQDGGWAALNDPVEVPGGRGTLVLRSPGCLLPPQMQEGHLLVRHFQFLRWSAYRDTPDSKKAFLHLLAAVDEWQAESGDGRTVVHCL